MQVVFRLPLQHDSDVAQARIRVRELCAGRALSQSDIEGLATAASEVARNCIVHAGGGEIVLGTIRNGERAGVVVIASDHGPGIANIDQAMQDGFSTGDGLGLGLPSARRLVHEFELSSVLEFGTTVTLTLWT
jgi:serine/threonine-protein kinase RsbT